jgi:hypothetical protein
MIKSLGDESGSGEIPAYHKLQASPKAISVTTAVNLRIRDTGLKTHDYDKGQDRFLRNTSRGLGGLHRPMGRCPVQPSSPLGPDQVNVLLQYFLRRFDPECEMAATMA